MQSAIQKMRSHVKPSTQVLDQKNSSNVSSPAKTITQGITAAATEQRSENRKVSQPLNTGRQYQPVQIVPKSKPVVQNISNMNATSPVRLEASNTQVRKLILCSPDNLTLANSHLLDNSQDCPVHNSSPKRDIK